MAGRKHPPLYYATYLGPDQTVLIGEGDDRRGYTRGLAVEIGQADATAIRKEMRRASSEHEFDLERVPAARIGTAEENQPTDPAAAHAHNQRLLQLEA